jgi:ribosomal protein S18 acetylase RimI-like enzyme
MLYRTQVEPAPALKAEIAIREARKGELPLIRKLSVEELPDELNEFERKDAENAKKVFAARLEELFRREGNEVFVASVDGGTEIAGYVWFGISERPFSDMKVGWIYDLLVVQEHRGKGVGEALLKHALEVSRKRGFELTGLMVRANNKVAYSLYEKLGFRPEYVVMSRKE